MQEFSIKQGILPEFLVAENTFKEPFSEYFVFMSRPEAMAIIRFNSTGQGDKWTGELLQWNTTDSSDEARNVVIRDCFEFLAGELANKSMKKERDEQ